MVRDDGITPETTAAELRETGRVVLIGTPSDEEPFGGRASSARAVLAATNSDAKDVFSIPTARELDPNIRIVAAATDRDNISNSGVPVPIR